MPAVRLPSASIRALCCTAARSCASSLAFTNTPHERARSTILRTSPRKRDGRAAVLTATAARRPRPRRAAPPSATTRRAAARNSASARPLNAPRRRPRAARASARSTDDAPIRRQRRSSRRSRSPRAATIRRTPLRGIGPALCLSHRLVSLRSRRERAEVLDRLRLVRTASAVLEWRHSLRPAARRRARSETSLTGATATARYSNCPARPTGGWRGALTDTKLSRDDREHRDAQDREHPFARSLLHAARGALRADHARRASRAAGSRGGDHAAERREAVVQVRGRMGHLRAAASAQHLPAHGRGESATDDPEPRRRPTHRPEPDRRLGAAFSSLRGPPARRRAQQRRGHVLRIRAAAARVHRRGSSNARRPRRDESARAPVRSPHRRALRADVEAQRRAARSDDGPAHAALEPARGFRAAQVARSRAPISAAHR